MNQRTGRILNEKGVALPLALFALLSLAALVLAFLSMGGMEPQISRNLSDTAQGRYAAESGIEWAFDQLALANYSTILANNPVVAGSNPQAVWLTPAPGGNPTQVALPGLPATMGTYTVQVRNDSLAADQALTGVPPEVGALTADNNGTLILTATGTYNGMTRQIQVVVRRLGLPPIPGAYNLSGAQADLLFNNTSFSLDGQDYICTANCANPDFTQRTYGLAPSQANMRYGLATHGPASPADPPQDKWQQNLCSGPCDGTNDTTYEQRAEQAFNTVAKRNNVIGKDQTNPAGPAVTGLSTIAPDSSMGRLTDVPDGLSNPAPQSPQVFQKFLTDLQAFSGTTVLQSTLACPMVLTGSAGNPPTNRPTLTNGCGVNQTVDLGTRQSPKLVYFRGDYDPTSSFVGVKMTNKIQGGGILVVEDGDLRTFGELDWDGIVIVTGRYVSTIFDTGSNVKIYGATVSNETEACEGGGGTCPNPPIGTYYDGFFNATNVTLRNSQEALNIVQRSLLFRITTWREL